MERKKIKQIGWAHQRRDEEPVFASLIQAGGQWMMEIPALPIVHVQNWRFEEAPEPTHWFFGSTDEVVAKHTMPLVGGLFQRRIAAGQRWNGWSGPELLLMSDTMALVRRKQAKTDELFWWED